MCKRFRFLIKSIIVLACLSILVSPANSAFEVDFAGSALWNSIYDIDVVGDYAYCLFPNGLGVFDVSDSTAPILVGQCYFPIDSYPWRLRTSCRIAISGNYAFLAGGSAGLGIINISDPLNPALSTVTEEDAWHVFVDGNYAYVAGGTAGFQILDVTNPSTPIIIGNHPIYADGYIFVSGNYAYHSSYSNGISIFDVSNPAAPSLSGSFGSGNKMWAICVENDIAYAVNNEITMDQLFILDVFDKSNPSLLGTYEIWDVSDLSIRNNYLYVAAEMGLVILDVSIPSLPSLYGIENVSHECKGLDLKGNLAYISSHWGNIPLNGLCIIDISTPDNPNIIGYYEAYRNVGAVASRGDYAYAIHGSIFENTYHGMSIVDLSDPSEPNKISYLDIPGEPQRVAMAADNIVYVSADQQGIQVIDVSDPLNPAIINELFEDNDTDVNDVFIMGDYAFVAIAAPQNMHRMEVIDITDPVNPAEIGFYFVDNHPKLVYANGDNAYLHVKDRGMHIVDITIPALPTFAGIFSEQVWANIHGVAVKGDFAFVGQDDDLKIIDISDPANPVKVLNWHEGNLVTNLSMSGNYLFVSLYNEGLQIINVENPYIPRLIYMEDTPGRVFDICVSDKDILIADRNSLIIHTITTGGEPCESYVTGDVNDDSVYNGLDIIYGVGFFKNSVPALNICECHLGFIWHVPGDVNGSCNYNGLDITYGVAYFKGGAAPIPCPACPPN
jgi:hypothetical protein